MEDSTWVEFQKRLTSLMDCFHVLLPEDKPQAISLVRESVGQMQSLVKQQLCSDAMRTVAAMAESLIQETYGIQPCNNKLGTSSEFNGIVATPDNIMFPQLDVSCNDNTNDTFLTSALYESLKTVNGGPEYSSPLHSVNTTSSYSDILNLNASPPPHASLDFREVVVQVNTDGDPTWSSNSVLAEQTSSADQIPTDTPSSYCMEETKNALAISGIISLAVNCDNAIVPNFGLLTCTKCSFKTRHRQNLHRHLKTHATSDEHSVSSRKFPCTKCEKQFKTMWTLKEHDAYIHSGRKTLKCPECEKYFAKQKDVNRHVKTHDDLRAFICQCGKSYKSKYHLTRHILCSHSK